MQCFHIIQYMTTLIFIALLIDSDIIAILLLFLGFTFKVLIYFPLGHITFVAVMT